MIKHKRDDGTEQHELPPIPCINKEIKVIVEKWVADRALRVIKPSRKPTKEDKQSPYYCHYHQYVHHKPRDCRALQRMFHKNLLMMEMGLGGICRLGKKKEMKF